MKRLALIGSKEFAEQIQFFAESTGEYNVVGFFDDFEPKGKQIRNRPILGTIDEIEALSHNDIFDCVFFAAGYNNFKFRDQAFSNLKGKVPFANIIMPKAEIDNSVKLGEGVYVGDKCVIGRNVVIGDNVFIHERTSIAHNCRIGSHTYFSGIDNVAGNVCIGNRVFVGMSVNIADSLTIVDDVWIGVGCVVAQNLEREAKYMSPSIRLIPVQR